jgi:hypothetical protein
MSGKKRKVVDDCFYNILKKVKGDDEQRSSGEVFDCVSKEVKKCLILQDLSDIVAGYITPGPKGFIKSVFTLSHFTTYISSEYKKHMLKLFETYPYKLPSPCGLVWPHSRKLYETDEIDEKIYRLEGIDNFITVRCSYDDSILLTVGKDVLENPKTFCLNKSYIFVSDEKKNRISIFSRKDGIFIHHIINVKGIINMAVEGDHLFVNSKLSMYVFVFNFVTRKLTRMFPLVSDNSGNINYDRTIGIVVEGGEIFTSGRTLQEIAVYSSKDGSFLRSWDTGESYNSLYVRKGQLWCGQFVESPGDDSYFRIKMYE